MEHLTSLIGDPKFVQSVILLLLTAALTGLLVPIVKGIMDDRKFRQQKVFEAELARQAKVIESQVLLMERLVELLWGFHFACLEVSYYAQLSDRKKYKEALDKYEQESWEYFVRIGTETGKAQRLVTPESYLKLKRYHTWMITTDSAITDLAQNGATAEQWQKHHDAIIEKGGKRIDDLIAQLARELRLEAKVRTESTIKAHGGNEKQPSN